MKLPCGEFSRQLAEELGKHDDNNSRDDAPGSGRDADRPAALQATLRTGLRKAASHDSGQWNGQWRWRPINDGTNGLGARLPIGQHVSSIGVGRTRL